MDTIIVTTEEKLTEIVENAVKKILNKEESKNTPDNISGCKSAVDFLNESGYGISISLVQKATSAGTIPCRRFHNKRLVFSRRELLEWAEKQCQRVGDMSEITLSIADNANSKLKKKKGGR